MIISLWLCCSAGCQAALLPTGAAPATPLVLYNWEGYMPQSVLDQFEAESGIKVVTKAYASGEEAVTAIQSSSVDFDLAILDNNLLYRLIAGKTLAQIDRRSLSNFINISSNFRDLVFDPENRYSVPFAWGTTGLLVRSDLVQEPVTGWADLWNMSLSGKIVVRAQQFDLINIALKSLGYPANSEDPNQLEAALQRLLQLKKHAVFVGVEPNQALTPLLEGRAVVMVGWSGDGHLAHQLNPAIEYILPTEGTLLWGDSMVISARSNHPQTAQQLINFILRPDIAAEIVKNLGYSSANEMARALLEPELANDAVLFPPVNTVAHGEWLLPLNSTTAALYDQIWQRFLSAEN